jgi:hypothetical protein
MREREKAEEREGDIQRGWKEEGERGGGEFPPSLSLQSSSL